MRLDKIKVPVVGDTSFRGACPPEAQEQRAFFAWLRAVRPDLGKLAVHPRNEGRRVRGARREILEGLTKGAADIVIPVCPPIVIELKRRDHTKSKITTEQIAYLHGAAIAGAHACVALGWEAAREFVEGWRPSARGEQ